MSQTPKSTQFGEWPLKRLMTAVVGSGVKSAADMSRSQATEAMERIIAGEPDPTTLGAFWLANRWKHNVAEELAAYADVMARDVKTAAPTVDPVDCGANYDGKGETAILGAAAGIVAAGAGTPVVVHSGDRVPTQKQDAYKHVLDDLNIRTEIEPAESATMVDETGFGFYYQPKFAPHIDNLWHRRDQMGVRTFINTIETMANPAEADVHLGSFYHLPFAKKMTDAFEQMETQSPNRVVMFQGMEGYDDIRPGYTKVGELTDGEFTDFEIETPEYGMDFEYDDLKINPDDIAGVSATLTEEIIDGTRTDHFADAVEVNAAFRIYARGDADSFDTALDMATASIDSGAASDVLHSLQTF